MCNQTIFGMARGSLVQALSLNVDMFVFTTVSGSTACSHALGASIFAAVSSAQACGGTPSSSMESLNFMVADSA
jgi:hypothetical protein